MEVSAAKLEANRRNAQKSTGPRSEEGKARSRYNALAHGMTAESAVLPGEDAAAFVDRLRNLLDDLQPRNQLEAQAIERIARDAWLSDRADRAVAAGLSARLRHLAVDSAREERELALELGQRLLRNLARPLPLGPGDDPATKSGYCRYITLGSADHPARLVLKLESNVGGCDWLLERWGELAHRISGAGLWQASDGFTTIRLMRKLECDVADDREVAVVMSSTVALTTKREPLPEPDNVDKDDEAYLDYAAQLEKQRKARFGKWCKPFMRHLNKSPLSALGPANRDEAQRWLSNLAAAQIKRLQLIRAQNQELADADLADAPARLTMEPGAEGDRQRRYVLSRDRAFNRSVDMFLKARKMSESGQLDRIDIENPVLPVEPENGPVPVEPDQPGKRPQIIPLSSVGMLDWCDGGLPINDLAQAGAVEPDADPAPPRAEPEPVQTPEDADPALPRDEAATAQTEEKQAICDEEAFFRNEPTAEREEEPDTWDEEAFFRDEPTAEREEEPDTRDEEAFFRDEADSDREEEPDIWDEDAFFRIEDNSDREARRADVAKALGQIPPALPERAMKCDAARKAGLAAGQSAEPEKRAPAWGPLDEASAPTVRKRAFRAF
jgi:hypothetical protein